MDNAQTTSTEPIRAEGLWFEDCGLIIQAENTLFRVSRDMLASYSPVFRDMLSLPPPTADDMMEGCPFVRLPDSAADVTVFLKSLFIYDFFAAHPAPATFSTIAGVLRMSHKYEVDTLRKHALTHVSFFHPTTLGGWEDLTAENDILVDSPFSSELFQGGFLSPVILARQLGIEWILPVAFYRLTRYSYDHIISGYRGVEVDKEDKISCMRASRQMQAAITSVVDFLWTPLEIDDCASEQQCTRSRVLCRRRVESWRIWPKINLTPLMPLEIWDEDDWTRLEVCDVCLPAMQTAHQAAKQTFWDGLPAMFGLPNWTTLEAMKAEAFK
ncbi:hypothetical protein C8R43DRAFT_168929 [Mycena crocata]|nr:hypothetical protein C8R43DRAFT_168929 [Mycena crocata]